MPPAAPPPNPESQARTWNMLCHLSALAGFIGVPFGNILGPLLVWQIQKDKFPATQIHGKAALNFQITVTLAGALSIPLLLPDGTPFPGRAIIIFLAFGVIAVTLLLQGTTLEALIRRLGLREDDTRAREERLARTTAVEAGLRALRAQEADTKIPEHGAALGQVIAEYEHRLAALEAEGETRRHAQVRRRAGHHFRSLALQAERSALDELWRSARIADEVHRPLQLLLDHEESLLREVPPAPEE